MSIKSLAKKIITKSLRLIYKVKKNRVLFLSFSGRSYSDNPRYVSEALRRTNPDIEIVWGFINPEEKRNVVPEYVKCINTNNKFDLLRMYYTSAVIVTNTGLPYFRKLSNQFFIQTWHGDRAFKKVLYDSDFISSSFFIADAVPGYCDLAVAGSEYGKMQYESAFRYKGKILMVGTPRDDILTVPNNEKIKNIKEHLKLPADKKICLYAPTLRRESAQNNKAQVSILSANETLEALRKATGEEWIFLLRGHPAVFDLLGDENEQVWNVSKHEDMAELLLISDMLITDYSSCAGDFALLNRPVILFQPDISEYLEKERSFYFDMRESPYFIAGSQEELKEIIRSLDENSVIENCKKILDFYGTCESGNASNEVANIIVNWIEKH